MKAKPTLLGGSDPARTATANLFCGITLDDGTDCLNQVHPDAPMNLCTPHLAEAGAWFQDVDNTVRPRTLCTTCGEREARVEPSGTFCGRCGATSDGFTGRRTLTHPEHLETFGSIGWWRDPISRSRRGVVYYIRFADRIKIGTTTAPRQRLSALPHDEVLAFEPGGLHEEAVRHLQFRHLRIRMTEWFHDTPELREHIATLHPGQDPWDQARRILNATRRN